MVECGDFQIYVSICYWHNFGFSGSGGAGVWSVEYGVWSMEYGGQLEAKSKVIGISVKRKLNF